jgi:serine/threonine protein kinase
MEILQNSNHQNVIKCIEIHEDELCFEIVLEYCQNGDLYSFLSNEKFKAKENDVKLIAWQVG